MYVLSWRTGSVLTRVLFRYLSPPLLGNLENKHQNDPLVSIETVRHLSTYIILYIYWETCRVFSVYQMWEQDLLQILWLVLLFRYHIIYPQTVK